MVIAPLDDLIDAMKRSSMTTSNHHSYVIDHRSMCRHLAPPGRSVRLLRIDEQRDPIRQVVASIRGIRTLATESAWFRETPTAAPGASHRPAKLVGPTSVSQLGPTIVSQFGPTIVRELGPTREAHWTDNRQAARTDPRSSLDRQSSGSSDRPAKLIGPTIVRELSDGIRLAHA